MCGHTLIDGARSILKCFIDKVVSQLYFIFIILFIVCRIVKIIYGDII